MSTGTTIQFHLRKGWTLRKVTTALVREWLAPLRATPPAKGVGWVVQHVVEAPGTEKLWEPGISTSEYEARLDRSDVCWSIRARNGGAKGKGITVAHLSLSADQPETVTLVLCLEPFPDALFDAEKLEAFLKVPGSYEMGELFAALLTKHGFEPIAA